MAENNEIKKKKQIRETTEVIKYEQNVTRIPYESVSHNFEVGSSSNSRPKKRKIDKYFDIMNPLDLVGYRFHALEHDLIKYFLSLKLENENNVFPEIHCVNIYMYNPQQLADELAPARENDWYFFTPRDRKYPNGTRPNRAAGDGYWKATGADHTITSVDGRTVGWKKTLVFYQGKPPKGDKSNWGMHEYRGVEEPSNIEKTSRDDMMLDKWVLCRIYKQHRSDKKPKKEEKCGDDPQNPDGDEEYIQDVCQGLQISDTSNINNNSSSSDSNNNTDVAGNGYIPQASQDLQIYDISSSTNTNNNNIIGDYNIDVVVGDDDICVAYNENDEFFKQILASLSSSSPSMAIGNSLAGLSFNGHFRADENVMENINVSDGILSPTNPVSGYLEEETPDHHQFVSNTSSNIAKSTSFTTKRWRREFYRFIPTDEELIDYFMKMKAEDENVSFLDIHDVNIYDYNPQQLADHFKPAGENEWYFFTPRDRKYPNGTRPNRAAGNGYWKATGKDKIITCDDDGRIVGYRKALVFYQGKPPKGDKSEWKMHEFRSAQSPATNIERTNPDDMMLDKWILCRIYKKNDGSSDKKIKKKEIKSNDKDEVIPPQSFQALQIHGASNDNSINNNNNENNIDVAGNNDVGNNENAGIPEHSYEPLDPRDEIFSYDDLVLNDPMDQYDDDFSYEDLVLNEPLMGLYHDDSADDHLVDVQDDEYVLVNNNGSGEPWRFQEYIVSTKNPSA